METDEKRLRAMESSVRGQFRASARAREACMLIAQVRRRRPPLPFVPARHPFPSALPSDSCRGFESTHPRPRELRRCLATPPPTSPPTAAAPPRPYLSPSC